MSASMTTPVVTPKSSTKHSKSKIIKLSLSPTLLSKFPSDSIALPTPLASASTDALNVPSPAPTAPDSIIVSTPTATANNLLAPPTNGSKRKGAAAKPNLKRTASQLEAGGPKPRGKPGPKKKARIGENGEVLAGSVAPAAPKLGPKANQGAINACLRALDRTGKPTRKWQKTGFKVRSFTGYAWAAGTYAAQRKISGEFAGDVKSDSSSSGDLKATQDSSVVASNSGPDMQTPIPPARNTSSPLASAIVNPVS
ncbi:hypothetical protein BLS_009135 [Venturia inaequalis]|uniref:Uncharacterized protein n=1 Tax=Venturia inaequalis TaxID=5025 RepID=A0A8H3YYQ9_VENIN|nr:hypothetical protein BLS_009135 [Venturia inaequalis]KAE9976808.1 hypothetical protein EG328_002398 [Venturia inaequalis]KAE9989295.1 hypothetical protein EG327_002876 [Venturia inaequalis]RDI81072.1 hypothetical protein Vi05172_g8984 [Venturia inaequalis]